MKFLADMGISPKTVAFLHTLGHDAVHLSEQRLEQLPDPDIVTKAIVFGTHYARFQVPSPTREKVRMRGCRLWIVDWGLPIEEGPEYCLLNPHSSFCNFSPPHPSPLPEGEGIFSSILPMVKICAEHYWPYANDDIGHTLYDDRYLLWTCSSTVARMERSGIRESSGSGA